eukprot:3778703-Pyramimonas_sp.AAC.1
MEWRCIACARAPHHPRRDWFDADVGQACVFAVCSRVPGPRFAARNAVSRRTCFAILILVAAVVALILVGSAVAFVSRRTSPSCS